MSIAEKLVTVAENVNKVYEAGKKSVGDIEDIYKNGYNDGYNKAESRNPLYYASNLSFVFSNVKFKEENSEIICKVLNCSAFGSTFIGTSGIKTLKIINDTPNLTVAINALVRQSADLELLDLREFKCYPNNISYFAYNATKLKTILGAFDLSQCTNTNYAFAGASALENIEFVHNTIKFSIYFGYCEKLSHASLMSITNGLKELVHSEYDITNNTPSFVQPPFVNGIYTVTGTEVSTEFLSVLTDKGVTMTFSYDNYSEEIINTLKAGTQFVIDCDYGEGDWDFTINSFKIISTNENFTKQTLTLGATNLAKLTDEEKAIATEKGWTLA